VTGLYVAHRIERGWSPGWGWFATARASCSHCGAPVWIQPQTVEDRTIVCWACKRAMEEAR
jgi:hypothetical protein